MIFKFVFYCVNLPLRSCSVQEMKINSALRLGGGEGLSPSECRRFPRAPVLGIWLHLVSVCSYPSRAGEKRKPTCRRSLPSTAKNDGPGSAHVIPLRSSMESTTKQGFQG
jgi:hypothetical protein